MHHARQTTMEKKERRTLWLRKFALLYAIADSLVELSIKDIKVAGDALVVRKNVFLNGWTAVGRWGQLRVAGRLRARGK